MIVIVIVNVIVILLVIVLVIVIIIVNFVVIAWVTLKLQHFEFSKSLNEIPKFVFESKNCMEWKLRTNENNRSLLNGRQKQVCCCLSWIKNRRIAWTYLRLKMEKEKTNQSWLNRDQFIAVFQESTELLPCTCFPNRLWDFLLLLGQVWPRVALELVRAGLSELVQLKRIKKF